MFPSRQVRGINTTYERKGIIMGRSPGQKAAFKSRNPKRGGEPEEVEGKSAMVLNYYINSLKHYRHL